MYTTLQKFKIALILFVAFTATVLTVTSCEDINIKELQPNKGIMRRDSLFDAKKK